MFWAHCIRVANGTVFIFSVHKKLIKVSAQHRFISIVHIRTNISTTTTNTVITRTLINSGFDVKWQFRLILVAKSRLSYNTIDIIALNLWKCEKSVGMRVLNFCFSCAGIISISTARHSIYNSIEVYFVYDSFLLFFSLRLTNE